MNRLAHLLALALMLLPGAAQACTVCMGDPNSKSAGAINAAIFLMLGVLAGTFVCLGAFALHLMRRAAAPAPPHATLGATVNDTDDFS